MRIDHGLKLEGDKLIITLPLKDGKKPSEVVVNGKIYAPQEKAQLSEEDATKDATSDLISRQEMLRTYQELCRNITCSECSGYFCDVLTGDCLLEKWIHSLPSAEGCKCPCEYREPCDYCHYDAYSEHGCPAEEGLKDERHD